MRFVLNLPITYVEEKAFQKLNTGNVPYSCPFNFFLNTPLAKNGVL